MLGRMAAEKKWSDTQVWGSGGGGHVGRHGGHLDPVRIHSTVDLNQEIWLELPDGSPHCLQVTNMNIQALEGHPLSVIRVRRKDSRRNGIASVCNLATGTQFDDTGFCLHLVRIYASSPLAPAATSILAVLFAGGMVWAGMWLVGSLSLFPGFAMARAVAQRQSDDLLRLLRQHLAEVHKWVVDELTFSANADTATVVDADERSRPSTEVIVRS